MSNALLSPKIYANTMLALLTNQLVSAKLVTTQFKNEFKEVGNTIYVKRPPLFNLRTGAVADVQDVVEGEVAVTLDQQAGVDIAFTSLEDTNTVTALLRSTIMRSAASTIAQGIDTAIATKTMEFPSWVGTPGSTIDTAAKFFKAPERLDNFAVPGTDRNGILAPGDWWGTAATFTGLYAQRDVAEEALKKAALPMIGDVQPFKTQNVPSLTVGTRAASGATQVDGANQNVNYTNVRTNYQQTLNVKGLTAGHTIKKYEVFSIASVNAVNPKSGADLGFVQQFVVLADATADGAGKAALTIANPIIIAGSGADRAYPTVTAAPLDSANITWLGTASNSYRQNAVFHKSAIALTYAKLTQPYSGESSYATDPDTGVTVRYWRASDIVNDKHFHRWDVLYGVTNVDRRLGTRISG